MILSCTDAKKTMDNRQLTFSHLLYLTAHHWRLAVNRRLKDLGMSQASWVAVAAIARNAPLPDLRIDGQPYAQMYPDNQCIPF